MYRDGATEICRQVLSALLSAVDQTDIRNAFVLAVNGATFARTNDRHRSGTRVDRGKTAGIARPNQSLLRRTAIRLHEQRRS